MRKTKVTFQKEKLQMSAELMRALAHPLRLKILDFIDGHGTINVNKIYKTLNLEQSITSPAPAHFAVCRCPGIKACRKIYTLYHQLPDGAQSCTCDRQFHAARIGQCWRKGRLFLLVGSDPRLLVSGCNSRSTFNLSLSLCCTGPQKITVE